MFRDSTEVGKYFHEMFRFRWDEYRRSGSALVVNPTKRRKKFTNEEELIYKPLDFEIFGNISAFGIFEISRLAVFEKFLRRTSYLHLHLQTITDSSMEHSIPADTDTFQTKIIQPEIRDVSNIVKIGIRSVFELIKGSKVEFPDLCVKAMNSLFILLEGLHLEALSDEPSDMINDIFNVLLGIIDECLNEKCINQNYDVSRLVQISSASLLSFSIIRGDTDKMLKAINTILTSKYSAFHSMILPNAVIELQKSVRSIIIGKLKHPTWFSRGILKSSCISTFSLLLPTVKIPLTIKNITCDGYFLYVYTTYGLYKIGTGYNGTIPRHIYAYNSAFFGQENGWVGFLNKNLYFILTKPKGNNEFYTVNTTTLELCNMMQIDANITSLNKGLFFVDGDYLCSLSTLKEDVFTIRYLEFKENCVTALSNDLELKLSHRYFKLFGSTCEGEEIKLSSNSVGINEELTAFTSGKEFSLLQTATGKILYNNKLGNQNLRIPGTRNTQCWVELTCPKISAIKQCVIGNEGSIGLLVYNDGSVYFIGFAKRGEDGENGVIRRQCSQIKPRRMTRMEGKIVTYAACNHGSTALVTDKGELYMFGKDAIHCEATTGLVSDLKNVRIRQVALGKVHVVVLTDKGSVYTFGYNSRGQCGRFFSADDSEHYETDIETSTEYNETCAASDETYSDVICPKGTHIFKQDKCMICSICHQCTGYGASCLASNDEDREPGDECGCGDGDSGCTKCFICKMCAFEENPEQELDDDNDVDDLIKINLFGAFYERNERKTRTEFFKRNNETIVKSAVEGKHRASGTEIITYVNNVGNDTTNMVYFSPAKIHFRTNVCATQIAAGLYHSVVLMENGEVYTFGSNSFGQLGVSDINHVGPVKANLPSIIVQIAAGSNHTVALTAKGEVYIFGNNSKNQFDEQNNSSVKIDSTSSCNIPRLIPQFGAHCHRKVISVGASGDLTYLRINKSIINSSTLQVSNFVADKNYILLLASKKLQDELKTFECVVIEKISGNFKRFRGINQVNFNQSVVCFDSIYNVLWSITTSDSDSLDRDFIVNCYNVIASDVNDEFCSPNILDCELAVPVVALYPSPCYQTTIHVLACLDMLSQTTSRKGAIKALFTEQKRVINTKSLRREDFMSVNRFQGLGNSWTYNTHNAIEAIRFLCDTDILLGGVGLYGGRGHYHARIKLFDTSYETDLKPKEGQLLISTDEIMYECPLKQIYPFMFEEPILIQANKWYIVWAQIKGSPSDCGNSGQSYVVTDDEVIFRFKSCLLSNNGTNVLSGQIPQLLYKLLQPEFFVVTNFENSTSSSAHILSRKFSLTVSEDGFKSLIQLSSWCWETFKRKYSEILSMRYSQTLLELVREFDRLVYINQACQHLMRTFIFETYPDDCRVREKKSRVNYIMAQLMGDIRELLQNTLSDPFLFKYFFPKRSDDGSSQIFHKLVKHILKECTDTFVSCFYVFYPTPMQKWIYLCYLLDLKSENKFENDFLIIATLSALYGSNVHLKTIFPILLGGFDPNQLFLQNKKSNLTPLCFYHFYPVLTEIMVARTENEIPVTICSWQFIIEKLLKMSSKPLKDSLRGIPNEHDPKIAHNSCHILSKLVAELSAEAMGINDEVQRRKEQMIHTTPIRFRRINNNKSWNTGNGSPDALCFTVNKPEVVLVGVGVFGGSGNYDYEVELLEESNNKSKNNLDHSISNPRSQWKCIAMCRGSFGSIDYNGKDMVELNFECPTSIQDNSKYAIKLRLRGNRTNNGELGQSTVTGPDDTVFTFFSTDLSFNGTSVSRGQLPYIIYYRYPQRSSRELEQKISLENQAREAIITISKRIFSEVTSILSEVNEIKNFQDTVNNLIESPLIKILIPLLVTHLSPLVALNPMNACQILKFIEELLPLVCGINKQAIVINRDSATTYTTENSCGLQTVTNMCTTSPHYSIVESDHPYKQATVSKYIVKFPTTVLWMSLEFDPRCGTIQEEDVLKIYVPNFSNEQNVNSCKVYRPLPKVYGNNKNSWPGTAIILPGNEVIFSLECASKYSLHDRGTSFGFKCLVIGFEMVNIDGLPRLELELTTLACRCASYLIKKKCISSLTEDNFHVENVNMELAEAEYRAHSHILNRGLDLNQEEILDRNRINLSKRFGENAVSEKKGAGTNELFFLMDFINYKRETSGGRLARWLQPDSFVDIQNCEVICPRTKIKCGWPTSLAVVIRDQYGDIIEVPTLKVDVTCVPLFQQYDTEKSTDRDDDDKKPDFSVSYKPTVSNQVRYNIINFMKAYNGFSFEEIRYMMPTKNLDSERLSIVTNHNGIYTANWMPKTVGCYSIDVSIDGYRMEKLNEKVEVKMSLSGLAPPIYCKSSNSSYVEKKLKFKKKHSAGLRIRIHPSLQSEEIGIISQEEIVTYIGEAENEDGIWVKLIHDCIAQYCKQLFPEAWCLKYNKHYEIELLENFNSRTNDNFVKKIINENNLKMYQVVKCGVSGHNMRAYPSLKAPTVGMIFAEQRITSNEQIYNKEGMWIKLDDECLKKFDLKQYESVWSLAIDKSQIVYLSDFSINKTCETKKKHSYRNNKLENHVSEVNFNNDYNNDDEIDTNQINNRNNVNFNVPPTPKKQRRIKDLAFGSNNTSHKNNSLTNNTSSSSSSSSSSSNSSSGGSGCSSNNSISGSDSSELDDYVDKFDKNDEPIAIGTSFLSDISSAISSDYQASIETSSEKSDIHFPEEKQPVLTQTGTQTSPKFFPRNVVVKTQQKSLEAKKLPSFFINNVNCKGDKKDIEFSQNLYNENNFIDESILQIETRNQILRPGFSRMLSTNTMEIMDSDDDRIIDRSQGSNGTEISSDIIQPSEEKSNINYDTENYNKIEFSNEKTYGTSYCTTSQQKLHSNFNSMTSSKNEFQIDEVNEERSFLAQESKMKYKTGISASVAESVRAVFAAFLWHEGLVHDAMTCASLLKFYPELLKNRDLLMRRTHSGKNKDVSQRYSVEVGLTGNAHHLIKPSTMKSLPSSSKNTKNFNDDGDSINVPKVPPLTLEYLLNLWNEISNTCFKLFLKNSACLTTTNKIKSERRDPKYFVKMTSNAENSKKYPSKLSNEVHKKISGEDICGLCNAKINFSKNIRKNCEKTNFLEEYTLNDKYDIKFKNNYNEERKLSPSCYILCDVCREQHPLSKTSKSSSLTLSSPLKDENTQVSTETHLIMRENAFFALNLTGNYNQLLPIVSTLPRLKTFACLVSFGIDGDVIPNELNSFTLETRKQLCTKDEELENGNDVTVNVINSFYRSVSMIGHIWKSNEESDSNSPTIPNKRYSAFYDLESSNTSATINYSSAKLESILKDIQSSTFNGAIERPIISFLSKYHNLQCLKLAMKLVVKKATYKNYGLRAFDWLLRTVTMPIALHDIMWWFVASFSVPLQTEENYCENDGEWNDEFDLTRICEHPLVDMALAGESRQHIPPSFHTLLQTIADLMVVFPLGSPLQQMAIKCWGFQFTHSDYNFLHKSKLFVNISKILSRSESEEEQEGNNTSLYESHPSTASQSGHYVEVLRDITSFVSITVSTQSQLIQNLIDNSTETYWESGEEDRRKMKTIIISIPHEVNPHVIYVHVDNSRDTNHKVSNIMILIGIYMDTPKKLRSINLEVDYCGWITTFIPESNQRMIRIDCKGDPVLRIRQIKVTGELKSESPRILQMPSSFVLQQRQCESETLKVFRLIIFQVFGELIENFQSDSQRNADYRGSSDLKEHMVGILFSRRKLNTLQKQVCTHIVQTIKQETYVIKEEWEKYTNSVLSSVNHIQYNVNDSYCFEMLCMVSALSGTDVGRSYLAQQFNLISDLLILLHVGTTRLQRQVVLLLKRVLPEVNPQILANITGIQSLPATDFRALASKATLFFETKRGILDIFLSAIAKILCIQVKAKNGTNGKDVKTVVMSDFMCSQNVDNDEWYLKGNMSKELAAEVDSLLKDMSKGKISDSWQEISKASIAENILNLANLSKITKDHYQCLNFPTFWIGLASLSVLDVDHVEKLSSTNWRSENDKLAAPRPLCSNHDDGKTLAVMLCNICGLLCLDCDRFLHLNKKTTNHERRVCKEEEESIKVDVHEGCGRVKLFWLLALVDSNTFKGVIEFRENSRLLCPANNVGLNRELCRFCGRSYDKLLKDGVCTDDECKQHAENACTKLHNCGHVCGGIKDEEKCLPCLQGCSTSSTMLKQDADDMCMICFTEALSAAPSIQLECGHVFHFHCCKNVLLKRWAGPRITFNFQQCPICKRSMYHDALKELLSPIWDLMKEVRKKALMRLEYEGSPSNYEDPASYSMEKYAYYVCYKCKKAYYGGEARCEAEIDNSEFNPEELICGGCSDISGARVCPKHGTDFLEYKCRYCCSVAVYFCFGTTHFCNACHEDFQKVISMLSSELPPCPAGPKGTALNIEDCPLHIKHPPTGEEFALGCGVCRTGRNF